MTESIKNAITFWNKTPCLSPLSAPSSLPPKNKKTHRSKQTHHRICIRFLQPWLECLLNIEKATEL